VLSTHDQIEPQLLRGLDELAVLGHLLRRRRRRVVDCCEKDSGAHAYALSK
jgi:hypothetical protein